MRGEPGRMTDDVERRGRILRDLLLVLFVLSGATYLIWRLGAFNTEAPIFSSVFWGAEVLAYFAALIRLYVTRGARQETPAPPPPPAVWPSIDVFITTYTEPVSVLRRTVACAAGMRGAHRTYLLDDGARPEMAALAEEFGCVYLARQGNEGAKAGNLNHGLAQATGELVAVFDADHAPEARFLEQLVGYFGDPKVALVQTPQDYFNADSFQHGRDSHGRNLWHEQSVFHWTEQPGRASLDAVTCCGCSMILRRAALDDIGGFPEATVTEDMHASVRLHKRGWRSLYHAEPLAFGVAPAGPREFLRQRLRWGEGNMQVSRIEGVPFARDLTFGQNLAYLMLGTTYLEAWIKLVAYVSPIIYLFTFAPPIWSDMGVFFAFFTPYLLVGLTAHVEFGRGYAPLLLMERFAMARLAAGLASTAGFFRRRIQFRVTGKATGGENGILLLTPQAAVLVLGLAGVAHAGWRLIDINLPPPPLWITAAVVVLALYNAGLAAWVLSDAVRAARLPPGAWMCPDPFPVRIGGDLHPTSAIGVSSERVILPWRGARPKQQVDLTLYLPSGPMRLSCRGRPVRGGRMRFSFQGLGQGERDRLERDLYASRWRRPLSGRTERRSTWLETLGLLPRPARARAWTWGLWRRVGSEEAALACTRGEDVILFGAGSRPVEEIEVETAAGVCRRRVAPAAPWPRASEMASVAEAGGSPYRYG